MDDRYRRLIGRRIEASVGEPWNFESAAGPNRLTGEIGDVVETRGATIICRVGNFESRGTRVSHIVPINRYVGCSIADFVGGDRWTVNLVYRLSDKPIETNELKTLLSDNFRAGNFLIGSVWLA